MKAINPNLLVIALNINCLDILSKRQRLVKQIFKILTVCRKVEKKKMEKRYIMKTLTKKERKNNLNQI